MRVFRTVPLFVVAAGCSLSTDFDRYARETPVTFDASSGSDAGGVEAGSDGGAGFDCAGADPNRIFCSAFTGADPTTGWDKAILDDAAAGDVVTLDTGRSTSPPASARAFVAQGTDRYALVFKRVAPSPLPAAHDAFGRFYLEPTTKGDVTIFSVSGLDEADGVALRHSVAKDELLHRNGAVFDVVALFAPLPTGRFFSAVIRRDDGARTATLEIDGIPATPALALAGARPGGSVIELRVGVVSAQKTTNSVTVWFDDVGLRRR